jgi:phosphoribosylanthranilate isomerase
MQETTGKYPSRRTDEFMIKVCGITNVEDALQSIEAGANTLGFNFYPKSPRFVEPTLAGRIMERLPDSILNVGVFVIEPPGRPQLNRSRFRELVGMGLGAVQLHGAGRRREVPDLEIRTIVATTPERASEFPESEIIIDSSWGTGKLADWSMIAALLDRPYILSGGLTPENVREALETLIPAGVDVCSGVEQFPGKKDRARLRRFLATVNSFCDDTRSNFSN